MRTPIKGAKRVQNILEFNCGQCRVTVKIFLCKGSNLEEQHRKSISKQNKHASKQTKNISGLRKQRQSEVC